MPFNGSGVFTTLYNWITDAANGLAISSTRMTAQDNDIASGLSNCITRDGQGGPSAAIAWNGQNLTGVNSLGAVDASFTTLTASGGANVALTYAATASDSAGTPYKVGFLAIPSLTKTASYVLAVADVGKSIDITTGGVTIPPNSSVAFSVGDTISIYNNSASSQTITQGVGVTLRLAGSATTGNRALAQRGWITVRKVGTDEWVASGAGLS